MQISKIDLSLIKHAPQKADINTNKNISNPFGVSFRGNVIQADVFETKKDMPMETIAEKGKLFASAIVSGINNFNNSFKAGVNAVISFGKKITSDVLNKVDDIANMEITFDVASFKDTISDKLFPDNKFKVGNLTKRSVSELSEMLQAEMAIG